MQASSWSRSRVSTAMRASRRGRQAAERRAPRGVETEEARRRRLLLEVRRDDSARPAVKTIGHMTPQEIKAVADARRADVRARAEAQTN